MIKYTISPYTVDNSILPFVAEEFEEENDTLAKKQSLKIATRQGYHTFVLRREGKGVACWNGNHSDWFPVFDGQSPVWLSPKMTRLMYESLRAHADTASSNDMELLYQLADMVENQPSMTFNGVYEH